MVSPVCHFRSLCQALFLAFVLAGGSAHAEQPAPWTIALQPTFDTGVLPGWAVGVTNSPTLDSSSDTLSIPLPATATNDEVGCLVVTVLFDDDGDGGPVAEWMTPSGDRTLLSAGLGETDVAVGLNARTLLLPQSLTLDGGTLRVSFASRLARLRSVTIRPARELSVAALEGNLGLPALLEGTERIYSEQEVSAASRQAETGDRAEGSVVDAELSATPIRLEEHGGTEWIVPISRPPAAAVISAEIAGLDPESWIEVSVNGQSRGMLSPSITSLNDPSVVLSPDGKLILAGWHRGSLLLPASLLRDGENLIVLCWHRSPGDAGKPPLLRDTRLHLLFATAPMSAISPTIGSPQPTPTPQPTTTPQPTETPQPPQIPLSNGSLYGQPAPDLFRSGLPTPTNP